MITSKKRIWFYLVVIGMIFTLGVLPQEVWAQPLLNLPEDPVTIVIYEGTVSYLSIVLSDVPLGYDVTNGTYLGWCIREYIYIETGTEFSATLYSSYDPDMPDYLKDDDWDMVNYILNHKQGSVMDVQEAIWYFIDGGNTPSTSEGQAMVNEALMYGEGFVPGPGQVIAPFLLVLILAIVGISEFLFKKSIAIKVS